MVLSPLLSQSADLWDLLGGSTGAGDWHIEPVGHLKEVLVQAHCWLIVEIQTKSWP